MPQTSPMMWTLISLISFMATTNLASMNTKSSKNKKEEKLNEFFKSKKWKW